MSSLTDSENIQQLTQEVISLLKKLIETPSFSKEEENTAVLIQDFFRQKEIPFHCKRNNVWAYNKYYDAAKPTILLNSHHDTVKPNKSWTLDPFQALVEGDQLLFIDNRAAAELNVSEIYKLMQRGDGRNIDLLVKRNGNIFFTKLTLRRMI